MLPILLILLVLPVNMKDNSHLPVVGSMERMGYEYSKDNLIKSSAAYATVKVIDKTISVIQSAEAPLPIFPVISFRPCEIFSAANDALQRMADALFWIMGISLSGTFLSGLLTFLSFKICFPLAIIFYLVMRYKKFPWAATLYRMSIRLGLIAWLFFPLTAMVGNYVKTGLINEQQAQINSTLEQDQQELSGVASVLSSQKDTEETEKLSEDNLPTEQKAPEIQERSDVQENSEMQEAPAAVSEEVTAESKEEKQDWLDKVKNTVVSGESETESLPAEAEEEDEEAKQNWFAKMKDTVSDKIDAGISSIKGFTGRLSDMVTNAAQKAENVVDNTLNLVVMFIITTMLIPLASLFALIMFFRSFQDDYKKLKKQMPALQEIENLIAERAKSK